MSNKICVHCDEFLTHSTVTIVNRRNGFTLIELLTVIAIIAVLASILMVAVTRVKANAVNTQCVSNLRQIYTASSLYANDHNTFLIPANSLKALEEGEYLPASSVVWHCPADGQHEMKAEGLHIVDISYARNAKLTGYPNAKEGSVGYWDQPKTRLIQVNAPATVAFWADASTYWMDFQPVNQNVEFRHNHTANVIFLDGHCEVIDESDANEFYAERIAIQ